METMLIGIALILYMISYLLLGLCYKFVEKHPISQENSLGGIFIKRLLVLFIFILPALMLTVPLFICIIAFPMQIVGIVESYKNNNNPFVINQTAAYTILVFMMCVIFIGVNVLYNLIFKNSKSLLYKKHHDNFKYFYEDKEGLRYNTQIYKFWFMILTRIILPIFISTFILSILTM